jgi:hypothetical protein
VYCVPPGLSKSGNGGNCEVKDEMRGDLGCEQFQSVWHFAFDVYLQAGQQQAARNPTKTINQLNASVLSTATQRLQYEPPN